MSGQSLSHQDNQSRVLFAAFELLRRFTRNRGGAPGLIAEDELTQAVKILSKIRFFSPHTVRLVFIGEFKAGKSTLINAITGREVAPVDVFELTAWVARYWGAPEPFCSIVLKNGSEQTMAPEAFYERCLKREFSQEDLAGIDHVDIGVPDLELPLAFIDCPGMGSTTLNNEKRMIQAIEEGDLVIWVLDADSLGGRKESAVIQHLTQSGMPLLLVINKCDLLQTEGEIESIARYVAQNFQIPGESIFPVSALQATLAVHAGVEMSAASGIPKLVAHLLRHVAPRRVELRQMALASQYKRGAGLMIDLLQEVSRSLELAQEKIDSFRISLEAIRASIQDQMEREIQDFIRSEMFQEKQDSLSDSLVRSLKEQKGSLSPEEVTRIFEQCLGADYLTGFWEKLVRKITTSANQLWLAQIKGVLQDLEQIMKECQTQAAGQVATDANLRSFESHVTMQADNLLETGVKTSIGVGVAASAYAAWLGPAAAHVSIGAAVTGIGLPIAVIGVAIVGIMAYLNRQRAQSAYEEYTRVLLLEYKEGFIANVVRKQIFPRIETINRDFSRSMMEGFRFNICKQLPDQNPEDLLPEVEQQIRTLQQLC